MKSAHDCNSIDWCGDGSGCDSKSDTDGALIAGLCSGLGEHRNHAIHRKK